MGNKFDINTGMCPKCGEKSNTSNKSHFSLFQFNANRPTFEHVYMSLAKILSLRSTCSRRKVGCVITSHDYKRVFSVGYNGNASGLPNVCDEPNKSGECGCLHAEENAIISCSEQPYVPKIIFTTVYPCKMCAKRMIQLGGVVHVFYLDDYHNRKAKLLFDESDIVISPVNIDNLLDYEKTS